MEKLGRRVFNTTAWDKFGRESYAVSYYGNAVVKKKSGFVVDW
jgi:hypothetical protein